MDYDDLLNAHKYQEIIESLTQDISEKTDEELHLLSYCYFEIRKNQEALETIQRIKELAISDLYLITYIYWGLENWEEMRKAALRLLKTELLGNAYYLLAIAESQGQWSSDVDLATKEIIVNYLNKALLFDDAPSGATIFISRFLEGKSKISALEKGVDKFPNDFNLKLELIDELLTQKEFDKALPYIEALRKTENSEEVTIYLFEIAMEKHDYKQAEQLLDNLAINDKKKGLIKADLLFKRGDQSKWLLYVQENFDKNDEEIVIFQLFQKAYLNFRDNNIQKALDYFVGGAKKLVCSGPQKLDKKSSLLRGG